MNLADLGKLFDNKFVNSPIGNEIFDSERSKVIKVHDKFDFLSNFSTRLKKNEQHRRRSHHPGGVSAEPIANIVAARRGHGFRKVLKF